MTTDKRSVLMYNHWKEASAQYDYFVLGISMAMLAYLGQDVKSINLRNGVDYWQLVILGCLLVSVVYGLRRAESFTLCLSQNAHWLKLNEQLGALIGEMNGDATLNQETGEVLSPQQRALRIAALKEAIPQEREKLDETSKSCEWYFSVRNFTLIAGVVVYILSKITW